MALDTHPYSLSDIGEEEKYLAGPGCGRRETDASKEEKQSWIREILKRFDYDRLPRSGKGTIRQYSQEVTGYSRAQTARLIASCLRDIASEPRTVEPVSQGESFAQRVRRACDVLRSYRALAGRWTVVVFILLALIGTAGVELWKESDALLFLNGDLTDRWDRTGRGTGVAETALAGIGLSRIVSVRTVVPGDGGASVTSPLYVWREEMRGGEQETVRASDVRSLHDRVRERRERADG